jgi:hypothetical protein
MAARRREGGAKGARSGGGVYPGRVQGTEWDEIELFRAIERSGARAVMIGRQALVALGLPVVTGDYDFWVHIDDMDRLNAGLASLGLVPTRAPEEARRTGRYVLEGDERVDVLVAREVPTVDGLRVAFDDVWARRRAQTITDEVRVWLPSLEDLIATKRFAARPKDLEDIRLLEVLRARGAP